MSQPQFLQFRLLKNLLRQLIGYGLNPCDWKIERASLSESNFEVYHKRDHEFRMHARLSRVASGELRLRSLKVSSL